MNHKLETIHAVESEFAKLLDGIDDIATEAGRVVHENDVKRARRSKRGARAGLSTPIWPPIRFTIRFTMARPNPVPPKRRVVELSACRNGWNRWPSTSGGIPIPVSHTEKPIVDSPDSPVWPETRIPIWP